MTTASPADALSDLSVQADAVPVDDDDVVLEADGRLQRIGDQAAALRFLQKQPAPIQVRSSWRGQVRVNSQMRELRHAFDPIQCAAHVTAQRSPGQFRRRCDSSKCQDETIGDGADKNGSRSAVSSTSPSRPQAALTR
jgi:hypothetical protein